MTDYHDARDAGRGSSALKNEVAQAPEGTQAPKSDANYTIIPTALRDRPQWLCWKAEPDPGKPKPRKVPYDAETGSRAKTNDPVTWRGFEMAIAALESGQYAGIGFVLAKGDGLTGLDLDGVLDPETGEIDRRALEILERFKNTYCEISPSRTGLHIFCYGKPVRSGKNAGPDKWLEVYDATSPRYLTVTGRHWADSSPVVTEQQAALDWLHKTYFAPTEKPDHKASNFASTGASPPSGSDDAALLERARKSSNGSLVSALWSGDTSSHGNDHSSADLALCSSLAFWTGKDAARMDRLFRQSGLMRPKWDERHYADGRTYGQGTIDTAIAGCKEVFESRHPPRRDTGEIPPDRELPPVEAYYADPTAQDVAEPDPPDTTPRTDDAPLPRIKVTLDDLTIEPPPPLFLIEGYLPKDIFGVIGTGGTGKSTLWLIHYVHLILGRPLWDMPITASGPVLYVTAEDGETRLKWRLFHIVNQMGLNRSERQQITEQFHIVNLVGSGRRLAALDSGGNIVIGSLADQIIEEHATIQPAIVTFDPMVGFGPGERLVNDGENAVVNAARRIAQGLGCATGFIHHVSKEVMRSGIVDHHAGRGGSALGDGARAVYQLLTITRELASNYPGVQMYPDDIAAGRLLAYHMTKLTDAPRLMEPLILRRTGWLFELVEMPSQREREAAAEAARREKLKHDQAKLLAYLQERPDWKPSRKNLEDVHSDVGLGRNELRAALTRGLLDKTLVELELPSNEQKGAGKTYIAIGGTPS